MNPGLEEGRGGGKEEAGEGRKGTPLIFHFLKKGKKTDPHKKRGTGFFGSEKGENSSPEGIADSRRRTL